MVNRLGSGFIWKLFRKIIAGLRVVISMLRFYCGNEL